MPDKLTVESKFETYPIEFRLTEKLLQINKSFYIKAACCKLEEYGCFYDFINEVLASENKTKFVLTQKQ